MINWRKIPDWALVRSGDLYVVRTGMAVKTPIDSPVYDDVNVRMTAYTTEANAPLGYTLQIKRPTLFLRQERPWWLGVIHPKVEQHHSPKVAFSDQQMYLYKFNGRRDPSYWWIIRWRTT